MYYLKKKRPVTLLEIMIVIFLIGMIASVIGVNMKGSLEEGKYFKTEQAMEQIRDVVLLEVAKNNLSLKEVIEAGKVPKILNESELIKSSKDILKDGWGEPFEITYSKNDIKIYSSKFQKLYDKKNKTQKSLEDETEE